MPDSTLSCLVFEEMCAEERERGTGADGKEEGGEILSLIHALLPPSALAERDKRDD